MSAIRVFDAAARHGNFSSASGELSMTQAAVSYQIKVLEDRVGAPLFDRHARGVTLTNAGKDFAKQIVPAMDIICEAYADAIGAAQTTLTINAIPTFATHYLASALQTFQQQNPNINVRLEISENTVDPKSVDCDMAIRLGTGNFGDMDCCRLFPAVFTPMISPRLIERAGDLTRYEDLLKLPLLSPADPRWRVWLEATGLETFCLSPEPACHLGTQIAEARAAIEGSGIAMLTPMFFERELATGTLIQPFDLLGEDGNSYWLLDKHTRGRSAKIRKFRCWLLKETATFRRHRAELSFSEA
ncbi:LysR family transcriptional regulator [Roseibium sp. HPY-6]|uniref:LysR family transcriptional regulator n=1 Tax=Roseibium sp. HPY-6 TaxID=3229852 RepID=UPI00338FE729